jgi:DNA polymerase III subunit chi
MTDIAFHFNAPDKLAYTCRLLRKALSSNAKAMVRVPSNQLQALDTQLWSFSSTDFLPHCLANASADQIESSPVILFSETMQNPLLPTDHILVNLCDDVYGDYEQFARVIEIVSLNEADRQSARVRWKNYTQQGHTITRHDLKLKDA